MADRRKAGSEREFCYQIAPGQDYYHRLLDGEIYLHKADEKICLPCAARRGLLTYDAKTLREPMDGLNLVIDELLDVGLRRPARRRTDGGFDAGAFPAGPRRTL